MRDLDNAKKATSKGKHFKARTSRTKRLTEMRSSYAVSIWSFYYTVSQKCIYVPTSFPGPFPGSEVVVSRFTRLQSRSQSLRYLCPAKALRTRLIHPRIAKHRRLPRNSMNRKPLRGMLTCSDENAKGRLPDSSYMMQLWLKKTSSKSELVPWHVKIRR